MYEIALTEWGLTPGYINEEWTEELLQLMFVKRRERLEILSVPPDKRVRKVSNAVMFDKMGVNLKTVARS